MCFKYRSAGANFGAGGGEGALDKFVNLNGSLLTLSSVPLPCYNTPAKRLRATALNAPGFGVSETCFLRKIVEGYVLNVEVVFCI